MSGTEPTSWPWWRLILHTRGSWLHGDPRGFRSRDHRLHSSGDYTSPPPRGEHDGLHDYHRRRSRGAVILPEVLWPTVGEAIQVKCDRAGVEVLTISVGPTHAHLLVDDSGGYAAAERLAGRLKQAASHAVRGELPGQVWARGGKPIEVKEVGHFRRVVGYIREHGDEGDWVWADDRIGG